MHCRNAISALAAGLALVTSAVPLTAAQTPHQSQLSLSYSSDPVVTMGDVVITHADLDAHMEQLPEGDRTQAVSSMERIDQLLQSLLLQEALKQEAVEAGLLEDESIAASATYSVAADLSKHQMKRHVESQLLGSYEQRAKELFLAQPEQFSGPPAYSFTHVLVSTAEREEAEAMRLILDLHDRVQNGEAFDQLVGEYSDDAAKRESGGSYTEVRLKNLDRNFGRTLEELEEAGDISGPVRSRFGWHLIRLDERHEAAAPNWEDVKQQAVERARRQHRDRISKAYVAELLNEAAIEVVPGSIERFQKRYGFDPELLQKAATDS